jgi:hypothetical protein
MWLKRAKQALDEEKQRPTFEQHDFYETLTKDQSMDLKPRGLGDSVLDLRPEEEREPKPISHYHDKGEIFYDVIPLAQRPNPLEWVRGLKWAEISELVALVVVLSVTVLIGAGLIYAALR